MQEQVPLSVYVGVLGSWGSLGLSGNCLWGESACACLWVCTCVCAFLQACVCVLLGASYVGMSASVFLCGDYVRGLHMCLCVSVCTLCA